VHGTNGEDVDVVELVVEEEVEVEVVVLTT
jgi:hypothetical protein